MKLSNRKFWNAESEMKKKNNWIFEWIFWLIDWVSWMDELDKMNFWINKENSM